MKHRYSPHPLENYFIPGVERCEFRAMAESHADGLAVWNLFWLSYPRVDALIGSTPGNWFRKYKHWPDLTGAIIRDARFDDRMNYMLRQPVSRFHAWFCNERDYTIYDCYAVMGPQWVDNVAQRSNDAAVWGLSQRPLIQRDGDVLRINMENVAS